VSSAERSCDQRLRYEYPIGSESIDRLAGKRSI
jgi:hypothetical protein